MGKQIHPRYYIVQKAKLELSEAFLKMVETHDLTYLECIGVLAEQIQTVVKYGIRSERHPDDEDKRGDEA